MLSKTQNRIIEQALLLFVSALYAAGLMLVLGLCDKTEVTALRVFLTAFITAGAYLMLSASTLTAWLTLGAAVIGAGALSLSGRVDTAKLTELITSISRMEFSSCKPFVISVVTVLTVIMSYSLAANDPNGLRLFYFFVYAAVINSICGQALHPERGIWLLISLIAFYAYSGNMNISMLKALAAALCVALLAVWIVPAGGIKSETLAKAGDASLRFVIKTLNLDKNDLEQRHSFNIGSYGWHTRYDSFGGPAYPTDDKVMRVKTDTELYLRGSLRYIYNGRAWVDEDNGDKAGKIKRYMLRGLDALLYRSEFEKAFDLDKEKALSLCEAHSVDVQLLNDNLYWAIYSPNRTAEVTMNTDIGVFYNNIGELFASRQLTNADSYTLSVYTLADDELESAIKACENEKDSAYANAILLNRDMPEGIDARLYSLVDQITAGCNSEYEVAQAICDFLKTQGIYTLTPDYVPDGQEFVSYFVLNGLKGYCMYFASAMAVMARIAGLPARYVEGYRVVPDKNGECLVTGKQAHAWAEVYFKGFGWVTFDATPGTENEENNDNSFENDQGTDDNTNSGGRPPEGVPTPTPTPTPTPAPTPTPEAPPNPDYDWLDDWLNEEPEATPTPEPSEPPESEDNTRDEPPEDTKENRKQGRLWLLILFLLICLSAFIAIKLYISKPEYRLRYAKNAQEALLIRYRACLNALPEAYPIGETPLEFAQRMVEAGKAEYSFTELTSCVASAAYAGGEVSPIMLKIAKEAFNDIIADMKLTDRLRWYVRRVKNRFGSIEQLP